MSSVAVYRSVILDPRHGVANLPDATVETFLDLAGRAHTASKWGQVYPEAMVYYAAHLIERTPGLLTGNAGASEVGPLTSQKDDLLQRQYGQVAGAQDAALTDAELTTTTYGLKYLHLRGSRCAAAGAIGVSII